MYMVNKKNKRVEVFDESKIRLAIESAIENPSDIELLRSDVEEVVICVKALVCKNGYPNISVDEIHKSVESYLSKLTFTQGDRGRIWRGALVRYINFKKEKSAQQKVAAEKLVEYLESFNYYEGVEVKEIINSIDQKIPPIEDIRAINKLLIRVINDNAKRHYNYTYLSAEVFFNEILHEVRENLGSLIFRDYYFRAVKCNLLKPVKDFDYYYKTIEPTLHDDSRIRKGQYTYLSLLTLYDRYLLRDKGKLIELPMWLYRRVASVPSDIYGSIFKYEPYVLSLDAISDFDFLPSTPTLFNAGTTKPQLSSCYINTCPDSLDGIFELFKDNAQLSKWAGGIGCDFTAVRGRGSEIKGTHGTSGGVIPYIKILNDIAIAVNQGGKRKGAMAVYLEIFHKDVEEFIDLRKNTGDERRRAHDIHTVLSIPDLFMSRVKERKEWTLFCPTDVPKLRESYGKDFEKNYHYYESVIHKSKKRVVPAEELWKSILTSLHGTGHPWITFKCAINSRNPQQHAGVVHSSNLCTEIALNTSDGQTAVCNLGSINLSRHTWNGVVNFLKLKNTVRVAVEFLDAVIDQNFYPTKQAQESNLTNRPIGLGIMGLQDMLLQLNIEFDSDKALQLSSKVMEYISYCAIERSCELAKSKGRYSTFEGSQWSRGVFPQDTIDVLSTSRGCDIAKWPNDWDEPLDWEGLKIKVQENGLRNSNLLAIAPTATISNIAGVTPTHEPIFRNVYTKNNLSGTFVLLNRYLVDFFNKHSSKKWNNSVAEFVLSNNGSVQSYNGDDLSEEHLKRLKGLFKTAWEVDQKKLLNGVAARTQWVDQAASTNLFVQTKSGRYLSELYFHAWELGLKTTYYLRTLNPNEITKANTQNSVCDLTCDACE